MRWAKIYGINLLNADRKCTVWWMLGHFILKRLVESIGRRNRNIQTNYTIDGITDGEKRTW